jgi:NDP-sugar pyrophosphorylase family protein
VVPKQAFILAGGRGERLGELTSNTPKPMIDVNGKPILEHLILEIKKHGVKEVILGLGYKAEVVQGYFGDEKNGIKFGYSIEKEFLGTGGALKFAEAMLDNKFLMMNGDTLMDINLTEMAKLHEKSKALATIALTKVENVESFGIAKLNGNVIEEFVEKPRKEDAPSNLANAGAYILEKENLKLLPDGFCLIEKTMFPALAKQRKLFGFVHKGKWLPTDTLERLENARKNWRK